MATSPSSDLPNSESSELLLCHPTAEECVTIWTNTSVAWKDSLTLPVYLEESKFLNTVPLARDGGLTTWILVQKGLPTGKRQILCSCESFLKQSLTSDAGGTVRENIVHGIASVFCPTPYRRRGYAGRMMRELAKKLYTWQTETIACVGTTLYSDIGKGYYTKLGWRPNATNSHIEIPANAVTWPPSVQQVLESELPELCSIDEKMIRARMAVPTEASATRFIIIPDLDHMGWHIGKEDFASQHLFGKVPTAKGAIAGPPGNRIWVTWTHRYYNHPDASPSSNVLYILRLVMEDDNNTTRLRSNADKRPTKEIYEEQSQLLRAILQAAQAEAAEWRLDTIKLYDPTPLVLDILEHSDFQYKLVEREMDSVASLMWYDEIGGVAEDQPLWLNNEHYAWQ